MSRSIDKRVRIADGLTNGSQAGVQHTVSARFVIRHAEPHTVAHKSGATRERIAPIESVGGDPNCSSPRRAGTTTPVSVLARQLHEGVPEPGPNQARVDG